MSTDNSNFYDLNEKDTWETPPELLDKIKSGLGIIHGDPCASPNTDIGSVYNFRLEDGQDGLEKAWNAPYWFVNPPFSQKKKWLDKGIREIEKGNAETIVVLTPDSTDTISWWHEYIAEKANVVCFLEGRLSYIDPETGEKAKQPTFGTAITVFGNCRDELLDELDDLGHVVSSL